MIEMIHFPQSERFAVQLRFLSKKQPECVDIDHDPKNDPPRKWIYHWSGDAAIPLHCEVKLYGPSGNVTLDIICQPTPVIILTTKTGLIILTGKA